MTITSAKMNAPNWENRTSKHDPGFEALKQTHERVEFPTEIKSYQECFVEIDINTGKGKAIWVPKQNYQFSVFS